MAREFAVIGLGRFGTGVALGLAEAGCTVVGVDADQEIVQELADQLTDVVRADACDDQALRLLGISDFDGVVVAIGDLESSLLATLALKHLNVRHIVAKALTRRQAEILLKIGADEVVLPEQEAGERLAAHLLAPGISQVIRDQTGVSAGERLVHDAWVGQTIGQLDIRRKHGTLVIAIRRGTDLVVAPGADDRLEFGDHLIVVGTDERLRAFGVQQSPRRA
ncbi:MAG TPA: TrkA family potassium uptake protein [Herpetosiphonaceae bacterium]